MSTSFFTVLIISLSSNFSFLANTGKPVHLRVFAICCYAASMHDHRLPVKLIDTVHYGA